MPEGRESIRLARMEEQMKSLQSSFTNHEKQDEQRFDRIFKFMQDEFEEAKVTIKDGFAKTNGKVDTLWDRNNQQRGAFGAGRMIAGIIGGLIVAALDHFWKT